MVRFDAMVVYGSHTDSITVMVKGRVCPSHTVASQRPIRLALISSFCSMKQLGVFQLHLDGITDHVLKQINCTFICFRLAAAFGVTRQEQVRFSSGITILKA